MALTAEAELRGVRIDDGAGRHHRRGPGTPFPRGLTVLTRSGLGAVLTAVVLGVVGWWWNYEEIVIVACGIGALLLMAIWVSQRPLRATVTRRLIAVRVPRGDPIALSYRLRNATRFRSGRATIIDRCADADGPCRRAPGRRRIPTDTVLGSIPTRRRGVFDVGPFEIERIDPFWLTVGRRRDTGVAAVIVHPEGLRPRRAARCGARRRERVGAPSCDRRPDVGLRLDARVRGGRRPAHDPLADDRAHRHADGARTRRGSPTRVHRRARHRADRRRRPTTSRKRSTSLRRSRCTPSEPGLDVVVRTTDHDHAGRPTPLVTDAQVLDLLTPGATVRSRRACCPIERAVHRRVRPDVGGVRHRTRLVRRARSPPRNGCRWSGSARGPPAGMGVVLAANRRTRVRPTMAVVGMTRRPHEPDRPSRSPPGSISRASRIVRAAGRLRHGRRGGLRDLRPVRVGARGRARFCRPSPRRARWHARSGSSHRRSGGGRRLGVDRGRRHRGWRR